MKTSKSTIECTEYNTRNAAAIAVGVLEALEPNDQILAQEKAALLREEFELKEAKAMLAVFAALGASNDAWHSVGGVRLEIEKTYTSSTYRSSHNGYRLYIGNRYGENKKWMVVGSGLQLVLTPAQKKLALEKIAQVKQIQDARTARENEVKSYSQRYVAFVADKENMSLVGWIVGSTYVSSYETKYFAVEADGSLSYNGENFTVEGWKQIVALKKEQADVMKNLKVSLKDSLNFTTPAV